MAKEKFNVGEAAEVKCLHLKEGHLVEDWVAGMVVQADYRMAAIKFETDVYSSNGWQIPDRVLWCAHGSPNLRHAM